MCAAKIGDVKPVKSSWLIDWWNEYSYFRYREAVVLNVSFFYAFIDDPWRRSMIERASALLDATLDFKQMIVE